MVVKSRGAQWTEKKSKKFFEKLLSQASNEKQNETSTRRVGQLTGDESVIVTQREHTEAFIAILRERGMQYKPGPTEIARMIISRRGK